MWVIGRWAVVLSFSRRSFCGRVAEQQQARGELEGWG